MGCQCSVGCRGARKSLSTQDLSRKVGTPRTPQCTRTSKADLAGADARRARTPTGRVYEPWYAPNSAGQLLLMSMLPPRLWIWAATAVFLCAAPADAQFRPRPLNEPATGEQFHIEASAAIWRPTADIVISSESFGIQDTPIDFRQDLGLTDKALGEFKFTLRALAGIARVYVVPNVSITREVSGFKVSSLGDVHDGHWADVDIYGTANFTRNVGAQVGFRSVDL